jgi:protein HOOK3
VTLKSGKGDLGFNAKALESKTRQQDDLIASQEAKLSAAQDEIDSLLMTVESLKVKNQRYQKLQDDYDELRTDRDQLARKANAAEKYRQKLQASQDFEKENSTLKNQIKDLQQQLKESDSQQRWTSERDVELEEYRKLLPQLEQECNEIQNLKKQLEFNNHALTERLESADEQHERDDALISELRERLGELEGLPGTSSPGSDTPKMQGTLHKDFEAIESQLYVHHLHITPEGVLILCSKSENDELKRDLEASKPPSTSVGFLRKTCLMVPDMLTMTSSGHTQKDSLKALMRLCNLPVPTLHKGMSGDNGILFFILLMPVAAMTIGSYMRLIPAISRGLQRFRIPWIPLRRNCPTHKPTVSQHAPKSPPKNNLMKFQLAFLTTKGAI